MASVWSLPVILVLAAALTVGSDATTRPAAGQPLTPAEALARLFTTSEVPAEWFTPRFVAQAPIEQVRLVLTGLVESLGKYQAVEPAQDG
jgi:hypothetical protein